MTDETTLHEMSQTDLLTFFEQQLDPDATHMAAFPSRDREAFMTHWAKILADDTVTKKTILYNGRTAGNIVCWDNSGQREVGYWLGKEYWGKGIATQALGLFLEYVTDRPLYACVVKHNIGSLRVLEKCGFELIKEELNDGADKDEVDEYILKLAG